MEMERSRNGGGKVVTFEDAMIGQRRNGSRSTHLDIGRDVDADRMARPLPPLGMGSRRRTYADGELDVFAAEWYFKGAMDGDQRNGDVDAAVVVPVEAVDARPAVAVAKPAGTRASEASLSASSAASANSQTVLLRGGHRRHGYRDKKCCLQVGVLMRTCSGKRSVRVDGGAAKEATGTVEPAPSKIDWYRELRMQKAALGLAGDSSIHGVVAAGLPPNLNLGTAKVAAIGREIIREDKAAELTCSSSRRRSFTFVAPVRANALASGRGGDASGGGKGGGDDHDDDDGVGSESSSDLFEIKSLKIDDCPYEPSEASIQWSVVTASAADASECGDRVSARWISGGNNGGRGGGRGPPVAGRQQRDRPVGMLAGCVSHRAVDVSAATAVSNAPSTVAMRRRSASEGFQKARSGA